MNKEINRKNPFCEECKTEMTYFFRKMVKGEVEEDLPEQRNIALCLNKKCSLVSHVEKFRRWKEKESR